MRGQLGQVPRQQRNGPAAFPSMPHEKARQGWGIKKTGKCLAKEGELLGNREVKEG